MSYDAVVRRSVQDEEINEYTNEDVAVSEHYSSLSRDEPPLTHTENFENQQIENFQGENTIIRNLDLEGDDYYEEECLNNLNTEEDMMRDLIHSRPATSPEPMQPDFQSQSDTYEADGFDEQIGLNEIPPHLMLSEVPSIPGEEKGAYQANKVLESAMLINQNKLFPIAPPKEVLAENKTVS
jgi:hypothetical protein